MTPVWKYKRRLSKGKSVGLWVLPLLVSSEPSSLILIRCQPQIASSMEKKYKIPETISASEIGRQTIYVVVEV